MKLGIFFLMIIIGSFVWNILLVYLSVAAGASWERIVTGTDAYTKVTVIVLVITLAIAAFLFLKNRMNFRKNQN